MSLTFHPLTEADHEGYFRAVELTYRNGKRCSDEERLDWVSTADAFVMKDGDEVMGAFCAERMVTVRGDAELKTGGVAGVAVLPERRRGGVGEQMMKAYIRHARTTGVPLASLYPFREPFYRKAGYEVAGRRYRVTVPVPRLPRVSSDLVVRRLTPADWAEIARCYEAFTRQRSGAIVRGASEWKHVLAENDEKTVYAFGDPCEGYCVVSHKIDFWIEQWLSEVAWSSRKGYEAILAYAAQIGINKTAVAWYEPSDGLMLNHFVDQGVEFKVERNVMYRVNDVPGALRLLRPTLSGEFSFEVFDDVEPENSGVWRVAYSPSEVSVERGGEPDFRLDVRKLAQAFMGEPSLADLARHGLVDVLRPAGVSAALGLLTPMPTYLMDFF